MSRIKQLLCFIIPSVVCWVLYFLPSVFSYDMINKPSFGGIEDYLRLFMNDRVFLKALFNTLGIPLIIGLVLGLIALFLKQIFKNFRYFNLVAYTLLLFANSFYVYFRMTGLVGYPTAGYAANTVVNPSLIVFDFHTFLLALQFGIFACFVLWLGDLIIDKIKKGKAKQ